MRDGATCADALSIVSFSPGQQGPIGGKFVNHTRDQHTIVRKSPRKSRRLVWDCIPFGFELDLLWLHLRTVNPVVDRFVISESSTTHNLESTKPLLLTALLANGTVPDNLASKMTLKVVDFRQGKVRYCSGGRFRGNPVRCFEAFQRFVLLETVLELASPGDLALFGDTDEIAKPDKVRMLAQCYPFDGDPAPFAPMYVFKLSLYHYGVHCRAGNTFKLGTRAFSVKSLNESFGRFREATPAELGEMSVAFTRTREILNGPTIPDAGWHFSGFGEPSELQRKLTTWIHSNLFDPKRKGPETLDLARLERCSRHCLELGGILERGGKRQEARSPPPCAGRPVIEPDVALPGQLLTSIDSKSDLPTPLLTDRARYPASWFRYVRPIGV